MNVELTKMRRWFNKLTDSRLTSIAQGLKTDWQEKVKHLNEQLETLNKSLCVQVDIKEGLNKTHEDLAIIRESTTKILASSPEIVEAGPEYVKCSKSLIALNRKILATVETFDAKFDIRTKDENTVKIRI